MNRQSDTLVINLFAGPGSGKTSSMATIFSELKWRGINCEMAPEFAKEKVWEGSLGILGNQIYIFGKQLHSIHRLLGKVEVIITDSPLLLSLIYGKNEVQQFKALVRTIHDGLNNWNIYLNRHKAYNPAGRLQTEAEAKHKDYEIRTMLEMEEIPFSVYESGPESCKEIADEIVRLIGEDKMKYK